MIFGLHIRSERESSRSICVVWHEIGNSVIQILLESVLWQWPNLMKSKFYIRLIPLWCQHKFWWLFFLLLHNVTFNINNAVRAVCNHSFDFETNSVFKIKYYDPSVQCVVDIICTPVNQCFVSQFFYIFDMPVLFLSLKGEH